jgi:hypothetical protein
MLMLQETAMQNNNKCLFLLTKYADEQGSLACLMNKYW